MRTGFPRQPRVCPRPVSGWRRGAVEILIVSQTVKRSRELLPARPCTSCGEHFEASRLTWVGGQWFCTDCHLQWKSEHETPPQYVSAITAAEDEAPPSRLESLDRVDSFFHLGSGFLRFGGYGIGLYLGTMYDFVDHFLHGVVLADVLTWVALCWLDARFNKLPVVLEFVGFVLLTTILLRAENGSIFSDSAAMGVAFLGFLITIGTKGVYQLHRQWTSGSSEAE
jgi:hypothetical protein